MSLRKKIVIAAAAVLVLTLGAYSTLAYLTADVTAHNVITSGNVSIELLDKTVQDGDPADSINAVYNLEDFMEVYEGGMPVMPGTQASKVVAVRKVDTSADCWVRVRLAESLTENGTPAARKEGDVSFQLNLGGAANQWTQGADGWYYYNSILTPSNIQTEPLLTRVDFSGPVIDNSYVGKTYSIDVIAQAVQSDNNPPAGGVLNVQGWPADPQA